jgi:CheY-like chemotaxis protein
MPNRIKILVVDDDPRLLDLLIETLTTIGYDAVGAADARQALKILTETKVNLIITDIKMPDMDGFELADIVRKEYPGLPVVFITGVFTSSVVHQKNSETILTKPFRISRLEDMIKRAVTSPTYVEMREKDRILVVEDDDSFRVMLMETLKLSNYSVTGASDADEAINILQQGSISAVITDIKMPGMDGISLAKNIKRSQPEIPVILITAYLSAGQQDRASFADGFLMKPFDIKSVTDLLESLKHQIARPAV